MAACLSVPYMAVRDTSRSQTFNSVFQLSMVVAGAADHTDHLGRMHTRAADHGLRIEASPSPFIDKQRDSCGSKWSHVTN